VYREAVSSDQIFAFIVISAHATATQVGAGVGFRFGHPRMSKTSPDSGCKKFPAIGRFE
jgi:hypothetical protein